MIFHQSKQNVQLNILRNLSQIFTTSFRRDDIVPDKLKLVVIYPFHEGETKILCSDYRPVSIQPIFGKILEQLMHGRLASVLDRYNILYKHQYGFQRGKSTDCAIFALHTNIKTQSETVKSHALFLQILKSLLTRPIMIFLSEK